MGMLASLGIEKEKPFAPDAKTKRAITKPPSTFKVLLAAVALANIPK